MADPEVLEVPAEGSRELGPMIGPDPLDGHLEAPAESFYAYKVDGQSDGVVGVDLQQRARRLVDGGELVEAAAFTRRMGEGRRVRLEYDWERRGLAEALHLNESIDEILYPLSELDAFFESIRTGATPRLNNRLAYICAFFVNRRIEDLRQTAREIDDQYAEPVRPREEGETE